MSATLYQFEARTRRTGDRVRIDRGISPVGVDISENKDLSVLTVSRLDRTKMTVVNTFMGAEAEEMYEHLTGQKVGVVRDE